MKTTLSMTTPEMLSTAPVEITAVAILTDAEYSRIFTDGQFPGPLMSRLKKYTELILRGYSGRITSYSALLAIGAHSAHGAVICGQDEISYIGQFPNAREWLHRRIGEMADFVCRNAESRRNVPMKIIGDYYETLITADNGIGDLLAHELKRREEIAEIIMHEDCFEISHAPSCGQNEKQNPNMTESMAEDEASGMVLR